MNENLNLAEILKDCPKGTKLWSPLCGECEFDSIKIGEKFLIHVRALCDRSVFKFMKDGKYYDNTGVCVLFPSREQWDWRKFKVEKPKFDPATLKPFDRVLVRNVLTDKWRIGFFEKIDTEEPKYDTGCSSYRHCIPYLHDTKHLLGKVEMEPEYYRVDEYLL
jgi:hypothetical protein